MWTINRQAKSRRAGRWSKKNKTLCFLLYVFSSLVPVVGQSIGSWQTHVNYRSAQALEVVNNKVYAATRFGFFYYDKATGETTTLSKNDGLSDVGISRLHYMPESGRLLIAYRNGNLDLLPLNSQGVPDGLKPVTNIDVIKTATQLPLNRQINQITTFGTGQDTYLSTDFGIVLFNSTQAEIRDTYRNIGPNGTIVSVLATALSHDTLFALTTQGILAAAFSPKTNLAYFGNWRLVANPGGRLAASLGTFRGQLRATVNGVGIYERQQGAWMLVQALPTPLIQLFPTPRRANSPDVQELITATNQNVRLANNSNFTGPLLADPRDVVADGSSVWVADAQNGLLAGNAGAFQAIVPAGPPADQFPRLYAFSQNLVVLGGDNLDTPGDLEANRQSGRLSMETGQWQELPATGTVAFNSAAYLPNEQRTYLGSYGAGLWVQTEGEQPKVVALPATISPYITSLATDVEGNLWMATAGGDSRQASFHVRRPNGQFESFGAVAARNMVQIVPDDNGFLWLRLAYSSLTVFDPKTNRVRNLYALANEGNLPNNTVRAMVKDRNGAIWVGTEQGVTVFDNPYAVFEGSVNANAPIFNRRRLLANEVITAMTVDGGNRKWIATRSGLYRFGPDGTELINTFTTANSPLPTDQVLDVAVEPGSGSVFVATTAGLVSYRGRATEPASALTSITIFPNPVRPDFSGTVGIRGLTDNATIKILDAAGQLVHETHSEGGTATWNLLDYRGRPAQTGIYLIVVITPDGQEGLAGKLAVVR